MNTAFPAPNNRVMKTRSQEFFYNEKGIEIYMVYVYDDDFSDEEDIRWHRDLEIFVNGSQINFFEYMNSEDYELYLNEMYPRQWPGVLIDIPFSAEFNALLAKIFDAHPTSEGVSY